MQKLGAAPHLESNYRPTEEELINLRAYRESAEPLEPGINFESNEPEFEALSPADLAAISDDDIIKKFTQSQKAVNFVIDFEVGSPEYYEKRYKSPIWPKGQSGITIGIGFDIGYHNKKQFRDAWQDYLSAQDFSRLEKAIGFKTGGGRKRSSQIAWATKFVKDHADIKIEFDVAKEVFLKTTTPLHGRKALKVFEDMMDLHPHSFGALYSLVYNRGSSMRGDRRREMRHIRDLMQERRWDAIPDEIRAMKRIWRGRGLRGLLRRRDGEAQLFEEGLNAPPMIAVASAPAPAVVTNGGAIAGDPSVMAASGASAHDIGLESASHWEHTKDNQEIANEDAEGDGADWNEDFEAVQFESPVDLESSKRDWARVRWDDYDRSTEYKHIEDFTLKGCIFDFDAKALETLISSNSFEPLRDGGKIIFALRGAALVAGTSAPDEALAQENMIAIRLKEVAPNHKDFRCVIGVYDLGTNLLSAYAASTVPCRRAIYGYVNNLSKCNMLPTGCYRYKVGRHKKINGCLREDQNFTVLRNTDDYRYDIGDKWDPGFPADNLHPSFNYERSAEFSSWGCLTVRGNYNRNSKKHMGQWALFRQALGLTQPSKGDHGKRFSVVLLTGLEAAIARSLQDSISLDDRERISSTLRRLRPGSHGLVVKRLQKELNIEEDGIFGPILKSRLAQLQRSKLQWSDGIFSRAMDGQLGLSIYEDDEISGLAANTASAGGEANGSTGSHQNTLGEGSDPEFESLYLELGKRSQMTSQTPHLEGFWDDAQYIARGQLLFYRIEKSLHNLVCGHAEVDKVDRAEFQAVVTNASQNTADIVAGSLSRLISSILLLPPPIADVAAKLVVKRILSPALAVAKEEAKPAVQATCAYWAARLRTKANGLREDGLKHNGLKNEGTAPDAI